MSLVGFNTNKAIKQQTVSD